MSPLSVSHAKMAANGEASDCLIFNLPFEGYQVSLVIKL